ncbi:hypothetical protein Q9189_007157 [Teloschistes chrysophthalmus]
MAGNGMRLSYDASKGVPGAFFGLAITAAFARTSIRLRNSSRVALDDLLFLFACLCLTAATGLYFTLLPKTYQYEDSESRSNAPLPSPPPDIVKEVVFNVQLVHAYLFLSWLALFAIKFCFLVFFRALIDRVRPMVIYWRVVVVITIILGAVSVNETFITCPHTDENSKTRSIRSRGLIDAVVSIPIALLWNVRIKLRQKLGIGALLCLSAVMSIIAIVKASGIRTPSDSFDILWELFWQQIEACVAVLMVSITAFRSIFISNKPKATYRHVAHPNIPKQLNSPWSSNKTSAGNTHNLSPRVNQNETPSQGSQFQSVRPIGSTASQIQPRHNSISSSHCPDLENGCESELRDSPPPATRDSSHDEALIMHAAPHEFQLEENPPTDGRKAASRGVKGTNPNIPY